jgi:hypothetical protein
MLSPVGTKARTAAEILASSEFFALRYEGPYVECTGITAVARQELRVFSGRGGAMIVPWSGQMASAQAALEKGIVTPDRLAFPVAPNPDRPVEVRVLTAQAAGSAPILYLAAEGYFDGSESPYDTANLKRDALFFGLAVKALLQGWSGPRAWVWASDWQTVPAALLLRQVHLLAITLHNTFDADLRDVLWQFAELRYSVFRHRTALQVALETCDVVTTVNRGYAHGLRHEPFHTRIMSDHLQAGADRIVGLDNANFVDPTPQQLELADLIEKNPAAGLARLEQMQQAALAALPADLAGKLRGKVLCVAMGRRSSQKLHDVVVEAVRDMLRREPQSPFFVFFATTHSDAGSAARLQRIQELCAEFPRNAGWSDGRIPYFPQLMAAGSFNLLCSLWEPHGGAFEATIVPLARAVDGLAAQVVPLVRAGRAGEMADLWHAAAAAPSGLTFREEPPDSYIPDLRELLELSPSPPNATFRRMAEALAATLGLAVEIRLRQPQQFARMVMGAVRQQAARSWLVNFGGMAALVEAARARRGQ